MVMMISFFSFYSLIGLKLFEKKKVDLTKFDTICKHNMNLTCFTCRVMSCYLIINWVVFEFIIWTRIAIRRKRYIPFFFVNTHVLFVCLISLIGE